MVLYEFIGKKTQACFEGISKFEVLGINFSTFLLLEVILYCRTKWTSNTGRELVKPLKPRGVEIKACFFR